MSKNCDDLISIAHHNELSLLLGYEEMKRITKDIPEYNLEKILEIDLGEIYIYCAVNCIENPYIDNYIKTRKQIEDKENANEREDISRYPPILSYDESGNEEELSIQPIYLIRSSKKKVEPTHDVKKKKKRRRSTGKMHPSQIMLLPLLIVMMIMAILLVLSILLMMRMIMLMICKGPSLGMLCLMGMTCLRIYLLPLMFVPSLGMLCLMKMIFLASQVLMRKFIMMIACLLFMMVILTKVGLEE